MTRDEFIGWLTQAVDLSLLTTAEARRLREQFDAGAFNASDLPLPLRESLRAYREDDNREALLLLALLLGLETVEEARFALAGLPAVRRRAVRELLQKEFEQEAAELAVRLRRTGNVRQWHRSMQQAVSRHTLEQANLGAAGRRLPRAYRTHLDTILRYHTGRLSRFADQVAIAKAKGELQSEAYLRWRSQMYAGAGRAEFFRADEILGSGRGVGWVADYIAVDDNATCTPCRDAQREGPYLEGSGPMPGEVCLGRHRCRCRRERRFAPVEYAALRVGGSIA